MKPQFVVFTAGRRKPPLHLAVAKDSEEGDGVVVSSYFDAGGKSSLRVWNMKASSIPVELLGQETVGTSRQEQREPLHTIEITGPIHGLQLSNDDKYLAVVLDKYVEIYGFEQLMLQSSSNASFLLQRVDILSGMSNFSYSWSNNVYDSSDNLDESSELLVLLFGEDVLVVSPVDGVLSSACVRGCRSIDWMPQIPASSSGSGNRTSSENQQQGGCSGMLLALAVDDQVLLMDPLHRTNRAAATTASSSSSEYTHTDLDRTIQPNDGVSTDDTSRGFSVVATFRPTCKSHESSSLGSVMHVNWADPLSILLITVGRSEETTPGRNGTDTCYYVCVLEIPEVLLQWSSGRSLSHGDTIDIAIVEHVGETTAAVADDGDGSSLPLRDRRGRGSDDAASTVSRPRRAQPTQMMSLSLPASSSEGVNSHDSPRFFTGLVDRHCNTAALACDTHARKGHQQLLFVARAHSDVVHMISTETTTTTTTTTRALTAADKIETGTTALSSSSSALTGKLDILRAGRLVLHPTVSRTLKIPPVDAHVSNPTDNGGTRAGGGGAGAGARGNVIAATAAFSLAEMIIIDHQKEPVHCHLPRSRGGGSSNHLSSADRGDSFRGVGGGTSLDHAVLRADPLLLLRDGPTGALRAVAIARSVFPLHLVDPTTPAAPSLRDIMTSEPSSLSLIRGGSSSRSNGGEATQSPFTGNVWETPDELHLASTIATDSKTLIDAFSTRLARLSAAVVDGSISTPLAVGAGTNGRSNLGEIELPPMHLDAQNQVAKP